MAKKKVVVDEQPKEKPWSFRLNGEPVDKIPEWAQEKMAERLSRVVSQYFSEHPDEYERFLAEQERKRAGNPS